jgi:hypothetical protein
MAEGSNEAITQAAQTTIDAITTGGEAAATILGES